MCASSRSVQYVLDAPPGDYIASEIRRTGRPYEHRLLRLLERLTRGRPGTFVDVGANIGNHTVFFAKLGRDAVAIEPNEEAAQYLKSNVVENGVAERVEVIMAAAGPTAGRGRVIASEDGQLGTARFVMDDDGDVPVVALDDVVRDPAIIKVDVENGEAEVLDGARSVVGARRAILVVESWDHGLRRAVISRLGAAGYHRFPISLCATPTYVYLPSWRLWAKAFFGLDVLEHAASRLVVRLRSLRRPS